MQSTAGIHHISVMVNDAQRNIDFYAGVLGLRLINKMINFERPEVYHLYFGNVIDVKLTPSIRGLKCKEPVFRRFIEQYGNYFNFHTVMGGLSTLNYV